MKFVKNLNKISLIGHCLISLIPNFQESRHKIVTSAMKNVDGLCPFRANFNLKQKPFFGCM